jgi:hypothetical protein
VNPFSLLVATTLTLIAASAPAAEGDPARAAAPAAEGDPARAAAPAAVATAVAAPSAAAARPAADAPAGPPLLAGEPGWKLTVFGWAELDAMRDSTQSFAESVQNQPITRPYNIAGDNPRFQSTAKDSRLGAKLVAPPFGSVKISGLIEADLFGVLPATSTQEQSYTFDSIRLRLFYAKLETPVVDLLVGQAFDLFGWGGAGFLPNMAAFGVMGELLHRNPQVRLSKVIGSAPINLEVAVAGVRPATRDSGTPDLQAGLKLTINRWQGASAQGPTPAKLAPMALALSAVGRRLTVTDFQSIPGDPQVVRGWGAVADVFIPVIPARGQDLSNTLSVTGEVSTGTGISDLYLSLTGGVLFPALPNPYNVLPAPVYTPNIDPGIVTFDAQGRVRTIDWRALMLNAHYHFPLRAGRMLALSGTYSRVQSSNALALTPPLGQPFVWNKGQYADGTLWWLITPAFQVALSYQTTAETYGDGAVARNNRAEVSGWLFF